jgi:uncharacterized protein (UPF0261 family)
MNKTVVIAGALDTKAAEFAFVKQAIERHGLAVLLVDFGVLGSPAIRPDISNSEVARAGRGDLQQLRASRDKTAAMQVMTAGLMVIVNDPGRLPVSLEGVPEPVVVVCVSNLESPVLITLPGYQRQGE